MRQRVHSSRHKPADGPSPDGRTASAEYLRVLAWAAEAEGLAPAKIFASVGIEPRVLDQRGTRVAMEPVFRAWDQIVGKLRDPFFGLRLAEALPFGSADLLDYLLRSSDTTSDALEQLVRYAPLMNDFDRLSFAVSGNEARVRFLTAGDRPYTCEMLIGLFARRSRELFGASWSLDHVSFTHAPQGALKVYDRVFQAPAHFGMPFNQVVFRRELIEQAMPAADPRLSAILTAQADKLVSALSPPLSPPSFVETVEQALANGLAEGDVTLGKLADQLHLSARTVQRRLRDAGLTHRGVVRKMRLELAARSLGGPQLSQRQIAHALGYSGAGSFHRAFKRWSGMTPGQLRARQGTARPRGQGR